MGDYLLDCRAFAGRALDRAAEQLRFTPESKAYLISREDLGLVLTETGNPHLWAPYETDDGSFAAVAGRAFFEEAEWESASRIAGKGGMAAKAVYERYRSSGSSGLEGINGNCVLLLYDAPQRLFHLATDRSGAFPSFRFSSPEELVWSSHPDVLADAVNERHRLDEVSMAEFLLTGTVTPPFTYYERIRAVDHGNLLTVRFGVNAPARSELRRYFQFAFRASRSDTEDDLAEALAEAFRRSVRRRTLPRLGLSGVALSGGLDSRALLACVENTTRTFAFCCYDEPNREFTTAGAIAEARNVRFLPIQRDFEYYGDNAEAGVRISGGMGTFANNHFLGAMGRLRAEGMQNLLTGCYCDYLFKGLPLNRCTHWFTGREKLGPFRQQFYFSEYKASSSLADRARDRRECLIPLNVRSQDSAAKVFEVEVRRTFPLCYEGDNQQRLVPQRITGWNLPIADLDVLKAYTRIPYRLKLNRSIFSKAVLLLCDHRVAGIPDANTGARPGTGILAERMLSGWSLTRRKLQRLRPSMRTDGSWPDWHYYVNHSQRLGALWRRPNPDALDFFRRVLGSKVVSKDPQVCRQNRFLFLKLLTLKIWMDQRA